MRLAACHREPRFVGFVLASVLVTLLALALLPPAVASAAAAAPARPQLSGQVVDDGGAPLAGARLELRPPRSPHQAGVDALGGDAAPPLATATSGEDGRFSLPAAAGELWELTVRAAGRVATSAVVGPLFDAEEAPPLPLPSDEGLTVRLVDGAGQPVAGARLTAQVADAPPRRWRSRLRGYPERRLAVSGDDGTATLPRRHGETLRVTAAAPGLAPTSAQSDGAVLTLRLAAARPVNVEVRDAEGAAVAGAVVSVLPADDEPTEDGAVPLARSGDDGRLQVWLPDGAGVRLVVHDAAGRYGTAVLRPAATEGDGVSQPPDPRIVSLAAQASLAGRTLASPDRSPVAGALVWPDGHPEAAVHSDPQGGFSVSVPLPVASQPWLRLRAAAAGFLPSAETPPAAGQLATLLLAPTAAIAGRVVNQDREPVAGARLLATELITGRWRGPVSDRESRTVSGDDGVFRLTGLAPGTVYEVRVNADGFAPASQEVAVAALEEGDGEPVEIVLSAGVAAFGYVVDGDDLPVPGAEVSLQPELSAASMRSFYRSLGSGGDDGGYDATTDADGRFEISDAASGRFALQVAAHGFAPQQVPGVELPRGEATVDLGTVILAPGAQLEGLVTDPDGRPLEGAEVTVVEGGFAFFRPQRGGGDESEPLRTGADGRFRVGDLSPGEPLNLLVKRQGYAQRHVQGVRPPTEEPVTVVLEPAGRLSGVVMDEAGSPVENAFVTAVQSAGGPRFSTGYSHGRSDEDGAFALDDVPPGEITLQVRAEGFQTYSRSGLRLAAGEEQRDLRLRLSRGAAVEGRVLGAGGEPLQGATVQAVAARQAGSNFDGVTASTDAEGRYQLGGLPFGPVTFAAEHEDHVRSVRDLQLAPGDNRLDFRLEAGLSLSGRVVDAAGQPVLAAEVRLGSTGMHWSPEATQTDADGAFTLSGLQPGTYRLTASKDGYASSSRDDFTVTGPVNGIELVLEPGAAIVGRVLGADLGELSRLSILANSTAGDAMPLFGNVDYEGAYRVEGVGPGDWVVLAVLDSGGPRAMEQVSVEPGAREVNLDLDLGGGSALTGRVLLAGQPLSGASVMLSGAGSSLGFGTTDQRGEFRIEGLEAGTYTLQVRSPGGITTLHREEMEIDGDRDVTVLVRTADVRGRVVDGATGAPLAAAEMHLLDAAEENGFGRGHWTAARSDESGVFTLSGIPDGSYRLRAEKGGYAAAESAVEVADGLDVDGVELALQPAGGLVLEVRSALGPPPARVLVAALDPATLAAPGATPGAAAGGTPPRVVYAGTEVPGEGGRVTLDRLPPGTWQLLVAGDASGVAELQITAPGPPQAVVLPPSCELSVVVPDLAESGRNGEVRLTRADGRPFVGLGWGGAPRTSWDLFLGRARVPRLPPGTWTVEVTTPDGRSWSGGAATVPGSTEVTLH